MMCVVVIAETEEDRDMHTSYVNVQGVGKEYYWCDDRGMMAFDKSDAISDPLQSVLVKKKPPM